jgi:chromosome partitioning protein
MILTKMVVLAVVATKGGTGKSSSAIALGVAAVQQGLKVLILDSDPQKSVVKWKRRRRREGGPIVSETTMAALPRHLVKARDSGFDVVLIDFAAGDCVIFHEVFKLIDLAVVPSAPAVIEMEEAVPVVNAARAARLDVTVALVRATRADSERTRFWINRYSEKGLVAPHVLTGLVVYSDAYARGEGVTETAPGSRAAREVNSMLDYLLKRAERNA